MVTGDTRTDAAERGHLTTRRLHLQLDLFSPSITRRHSLRSRRVFRYVHLGQMVERTVTETYAVRIHAGDTREEGAQWSERTVHRELDTAPYLDDLKVRRFVVDHPDGASLDEIAVAMNLSKEGVAGCERRALRKILVLALEDEVVFQWAVNALGLTPEWCEAYIERRLSC